MRLRIPDVAVLLIALTVGGLAIYRSEPVIAAICLAIGMGYAPLSFCGAAGIGGTNGEPPRPGRS